MSKNERIIKPEPRNIVSHYFSTERCNGNCAYCIRNTNNFQTLDLFSTRQNVALRNGLNIVYPSIDSEFFDNPNALLQLENMAKCSVGCKILFNLSTKSKIDKETLKKLAQINAEMIDKEKGFVKVGVTFTTKYRINEFEPKSSSYSERLNTLDELACCGIPTSISIRPVLPFIRAEEYADIIDETSEFTDMYHLGSLYVEYGSSFYNNYIKGKGYKQDISPVEWLNGKKMLKVAESSILKEQLITYIESKNIQTGEGINVFDSEKDLMEFIYNRYGIEKITEKSHQKTLDNLQLLKTASNRG